MFEYSKLNKMYELIEEESKEDNLYYISVDVARLGKDSTVVCLWKEMEMVKFYKYTKQRVDITANKIQEIAEDYSIPRNRIVVDEDGVGGGVVDILRCVGFVNNSRPKVISRFSNYENLKTQCYFELKRYVDKELIKISASEYKEEVMDELALVKERDADKDGRKKITKKQDVKEQLGRSPDFADALMMRMWFELGKLGEPEDLNQIYKFADSDPDTLDIMHDIYIKKTNPTPQSDYESAIDNMLADFS
jgi:hypothetical protein